METRIVARLVTARLCLTRVLIQNLHRMLYLLEESEATSSNKAIVHKMQWGIFNSSQLQDFFLYLM